MTTLIVLSVVVIVLLIAGLAFYLYVVGAQLTRIATNLEECTELVRDDRAQRRGDRARASSTSTAPAGSSPVRCRCCTGWPRGSSSGATSSRRGGRSRPGRPASGALHAPRLGRRGARPRAGRAGRPPADASRLAVKWQAAVDRLRQVFPTSAGPVLPPSTCGGRAAGLQLAAGRREPFPVSICSPWGS